MYARNRVVSTILAIFTSASWSLDGSKDFSPMREARSDAGTSSTPSALVVPSVFKTRFVLVLAETRKPRSSSVASLRSLPSEDVRKYQMNDQ